ncbi:hypothetical protein PT974_01063 [Cladobotryum mycophilum]|uniref:Uncharacterized protein n=1 Tax=Cladobotryum mycophilum TaxID=491253 RepID=A0ABR0T2L7_9HYPO
MVIRGFQKPDSVSLGQQGPQASNALGLGHIAGLHNHGLSGSHKISRIKSWTTVIDRPRIMIHAAINRIGANNDRGLAGSCWTTCSFDLIQDSRVSEFNLVMMTVPWK